MNSLPLRYILIYLFQDLSVRSNIHYTITILLNIIAIRRSPPVSKNGIPNVQIFHILFIKSSIIDDTDATAVSSRWFMSRVFKKLVVHNLQVVVEKCQSSLVTTASLILVFQATCFETECIILLGHQTNQVGERMLISFLLQYLQSVESSSIS